MDTMRRRGDIMDIYEPATLAVAFAALMLLSVMTAWYARTKGKNPFLWFFLSLFFFPFSNLILFFLPDRHAAAPDPAVERPIFHSEAAYPKPDSEGESGIPVERPLQRMPFDPGLKWYYITQSCEQVGPVSLSGLRKAATDGTLTEESYIWCDEFADWKKIKELSNSRTLFDRDFLE